MLRIPSGAAALALAILFAGCGGGGGGSATPIAPGGTTPVGTGGGGNITPASAGQVNTGSTYTVYLSSNGSTVNVGVAPLNAGPPDAISTWSVVTSGAVVQYPDGSLQVSDSLGNFDASQSLWALTNVANLAANPNLEPEVLVFVPSIPTEVPADLIVAAYAPQGSPTMTAGTVRSPLGSRMALTTSTASEVASVTTFPRGAAMFDNEARSFHAVASDTDGQSINLTNANVKWSVAACAGSSGAGKIAINAKDAGKATYTPPAAGSGCDIVVASIAANGSTYGSTSNALYYDKSSGVTVSGTLNDSTNKAVPLGLVRLYGGGKEFYNGNLVAYVSNGAFSRTVPPNRTLSPVGGNIVISAGKAAGSFFNLTPGTINVGAAGSTVAAATYTEGAAFANPYKPLPPLDRAIRDAHYFNAIATEQFAFDRPLTGAANPYPACGIDAIINGQSNSTTCATVLDGAYFQKWWVTNVSATSWIFTEPPTIEGGRSVVAVQKVSSVPAGTIPAGISDSNTQGIANCTNATPCFTYQRFYNPTGFNATSAGLTAISSTNGLVTSAPAAAGSIIAADGAFAESGTTYPFNVKYVRNEYTLGHQIQGQPLYTHTLSFTYASGGATTAGSLTNNWYNAAGLPAGTLALTRTPGAGFATSPIAYTYSGTGTRTYYKGSTASVTLGYAITNGAQNYDRSGGYSVAVTSSSAPDQSVVGTAVTFANNAGASIATAMCPTGYPAAVNAGARSCGTVTNPNFTGTTNNSLARFTVDGTYFVSLTADPSLGAGTANFHLYPQSLYPTMDEAPGSRNRGLRLFREKEGCRAGVP
ncbi:MAG: hypothetical protein NVSMB64_30280 [Candidatus Velthaea sp.]